MKKNHLSIISLALAGSFLISIPVLADKIKCGKIDDKDLKEECKDVKKDGIGEKEIVKDGKVRCRKIEDDKLRKECYEQKFD